MTAVLRSELIDLLWKKAEPTVFITKDEFVVGLKDWSFYPVVTKDVVIAIVGENGAEMHFETTETGLPISRKVVKDVLQRLIDRYGYAVTKTSKNEIRQQRFNKAIGFEVAGEDEYDIHYKITKVRGGHS